MKFLCLDVETFGLYQDAPVQRMFHPRRMELLDGIAPSRMIYTTALTWRGPVEEKFGSDTVVSTVAPDAYRELRHGIFVMSNAVHRRRLWAWLQYARRTGMTLLGQNIPFDVMCLRYCYPECRPLLDHPLPLMDTMITNYLYDEGRPEKSLKNLSPLLGITKYDTNEEIKRFKDAHDPEGWKYNVQDTCATLLLQERLERDIRSFYGPKSTKLSPYCFSWYSELLWTIIWMSESGICMDEDRLRGLLARYERAQGSILLHAQEEYGIPLRGKGSEKAKVAAIEDSVTSVRVFNGKIYKPGELELTAKKKRVSFDKENRNLLMNDMDHDWMAYKKLRLMSSYQDVSGVLDRYLFPLLVGRGKKHDNPDTKLLGGFAYPRWYPVPSEWEDKTTGGTKQARITPKGPAASTFPPPIKACIQTRFPGGWLVWFDYSQIEFRVAALLSDDPAMMEAYRGNIDFHEETAKLIFGPDIVNHPRHLDLYRQVGKKLNFLMLFRGGAYKFHETLLREVGLDYPIPKCEEAIRIFWDRHLRLREWQDELLEFVRTHGYFELPLIGQSRLFLGGRNARRKSEKEIVNLPDQAIAANITLSGQFAVQAELKRRRMKALLPLNIYDASVVECPHFEIGTVRRVLTDHLSQPPYFVALCNHLGRSIPLKYELKETQNARI